MEVSVRDARGVELLPRSSLQLGPDDSFPWLSTSPSGWTAPPPPPRAPPPPPWRCVCEDNAAHRAERDAPPRLGSAAACCPGRLRRRARLRVLRARPLAPAQTPRPPGTVSCGRHGVRCCLQPAPRSLSSALHLLAPRPPSATTPRTACATMAAPAPRLSTEPQLTEPQSTEPQSTEPRPKSRVLRLLAIPRRLSWLACLSLQLCVTEAVTVCSGGCNRT